MTQSRLLDLLEEFLNLCSAAMYTDISTQEVSLKELACIMTAKNH